jgi:hypothetical protein
MTTENEETTTREDEGAAGSPRTVSQCGHSEPGTASGAGHDKNEELKRERRHVPEEPAGRHEPQPPRQPAPDKAPKPVERVTALRGQAIARPPAALKARRKSADQEVLASSDIPYEAPEKALCGILCLFVERQDRATEALLLRASELQYRMDDGEYDRRTPAGNRKG